MLANLPLFIFIGVLFVLMPAAMLIIDLKKGNVNYEDNESD